MDGSIVGGAHTFLVGAMAVLALEHEVHFISKGVPIARSAARIQESNAIINTDLWDGSNLVDDATPGVAAWVNELNPDVYVVSVSPDIGWTVLPYLDPRIATFTIGHNDERSFYDPVKHYAPFLTRAIGVSDTICRRYVDECGMAPARVEWIPYGVETLANFDASVSRVADRPDNKLPLRLAYVGRFENKQKRIADIVAIARRLAEEGVSFEFDLVGDGDEMPFVREQLTDLVDTGSGRIHGWLSSDQVIQKLRDSEVFVLASAYEGFCISLIEAMANGCCPVVTDIESGNKQLVEDGVNGFVVPVGDVEAFVDRIKLLAGNRERLNEMRLEAWETGREYSIERMVSNYISCFEGAIEDARLNPRTPDPEFPLMESCRSKYPLWLRRLKAKAKKLATN